MCRTHNLLNDLNCLLLRNLNLFSLKSRSAIITSLISTWSMAKRLFLRKLTTESPFNVSIN